jgi:hypothetical protein
MSWLCLNSITLNNNSNQKFFNPKEHESLILISTENDFKIYDLSLIAKIKSNNILKKKSSNSRVLAIIEYNFLLSSQEY